MSKGLKNMVKMHFEVEIQFVNESIYLTNIIKFIISKNAEVKVKGMASNLSCQVKKTKHYELIN